MSRCGKFSFVSLLFYNVRVVILTLYRLIRFISLLHSGIAFELSNTMDASTVDDALFFYTGQTPCNAVVPLNHPFHRTLAAVPSVHNKIKLLTADPDIFWYSSVNQNFHLRVHRVELDWGRHDDHITHQRPDLL